jgi:hypothetical protein
MTERADLERRIAVLDRRLAETHDGNAPFGPYVLKWARERGRILAHLKRASDIKIGPIPENSTR